MTRVLLAVLVSLASVGAGAALLAVRSDSSGAGAIAQPPVAPLGDLPVAPAAERVDLRLPTFSDPTSVTNPLHPTSTLESELLLGRADGRALRVEIALLPERKLVDWNGLHVEALVAQYVAFLDGELHEVALDFYAQADDGSVWYLGEDVFNYEDGAVVDTEGTWLAGLHGPGAMIMPADPQVGDVYRPENMPGHVFEEVTVEQTGVTVTGPRGPVGGAIVVDELHLDGGHEEKTFAPGYGELSTGTGKDVEAVALAVPIDALPGPPPRELVELSKDAGIVFALAREGAWREARAATGRLRRTWSTLRSGAPPLLGGQTSEALGVLERAVGRRDRSAAAQAALTLAQASLDLLLRHRPVAEIELARFDLRAAQLVVDAAARDEAAVAGDLAALEWTRDRFAHALEGSDLFRLDRQLDALRAAVNDGDTETARSAAARLRRAVTTLSKGTGSLLDLST